jgi:hypothetical protein
MKTILNFFAILSFGFALMSCNSYQYVQLKSDLPIDYSSKRYYVEDEMVRVEFDFHGYDFPVKTAIYNISDGPIYIDRISSVYTQDGQKMADAMGKNPIALSGTTTGTEDGTVGFTNLRGSVGSSADLIYIPAGNHVTMSRYPFPSAYDPHKKHMASGGYENQFEGAYPANRRVYNIPNPKKYSVVIAYSASRDLSAPNELRGDFYESRVFSSGSPPTQFEMDQKSSTYIKHKDHSGTVGGVILAGGLLLAIILAINADPVEDP